MVGLFFFRENLLFKLEWLTRYKEADFNPDA